MAFTGQEKMAMAGMPDNPWGYAVPYKSSGPTNSVTKHIYLFALAGDGAWALTLLGCIDLADSIRDAIAAASLSRSFTAIETTTNLAASNTVVRTYQPEYALTDLADVRVTVIPVSTLRNLSGRGVRGDMCVIDVVLDHLPDNDDDADTDLLVMDEIKNLFDTHDGKKYSNARFVDFDDQDPIYPIDAQHEQNRLRAAVRMNFRQYRKV